MWPLWAIGTFFTKFFLYHFVQFTFQVKISLSSSILHSICGFTKSKVFKLFSTSLCIDGEENKSGDDRHNWNICTSAIPLSCTDRILRYASTEDNTCRNNWRVSDVCWARFRTFSSHHLVSLPPKWVGSKWGDVCSHHYYDNQLVSVSTTF